MVAQIFNEIQSPIGDNLFLNSGWQTNTNGWLATNAIYNTTLDFDGCRSLQSFENVYEDNMQTALFTYETKTHKVGNGECAFSIYIYSPEVAIANVNVKLKCVFILNGVSSAETFLTCAMQDLGNKVFKATYIFRNQGAYRFDELFFSIYANVITPAGKAGDESYSIYAYKPKLEYGNAVTEYRPAIADGISQGENIFQNSKVGDIANVLSYNYKKNLTKVGSFSMEIPKNTLYADKIEPESFILYDNDWLIVDNIKLENDIYTIEGTDAKGLLSKRVTLNKTEYGTEYSFDSVEGNTEDCLKHFILTNLVNPINANRKIPLLTIAPSKGRGLENDSYTSRFEPLNEVATKLCQYGSLGYDITVDLPNDKMVFDVAEVIDKTSNQRDRNQVIFDIERGNIVSMSREKGKSNFKNVFIAGLEGGITDYIPYATEVLRSAETPKGIKRNEMYINVSCENYTEVESMAKQEMPNYLETDSFSVEVNNPQEYGVIYEIGDKVTLRDAFINTMSDKVIRGFDKSMSNGQKTITLEFGEGKPKPLNKLEQKIKQKGVL